MPKKKGKSFLRRDVRIRMLESDYLRVKSSASRSGLTVTSYIRMTVLARVEREERSG